MSQTVQDYIFLLFLALWFGGGIITFSRLRRKQLVYLKHFPPVYEGRPLEKVAGTRSPLKEKRAIWHAMFHRQPNAALEHLRREVLRRYLYYLAWNCGFPLVCSGVFVGLVLSGVIR